MSNSDNQNRIAILDAGAQYTKLIDKMVRSLSIESVILPLNTPAKELKNLLLIDNFHNKHQFNSKLT